MNPDDRDAEIAEILDARSGQSAIAAGSAQIDERPDLRRLLAAADLAWASEQSAPPLADDPVAAMLGLVPDPDMMLDGKALAAARKRAGLTVSALASKLTERGWDITSKDIFAWESGRGSPRMPALINALAEETGADADRLRRAAGADPERARIAAVVNMAAFKSLAQRWARIQGTTVALASSALESRMLIAVHRGGAPDAGILLDSLEAMVSAVEGNQRS
jgi:transcriptional regulator with XRE-family HTH domain